MLNVPFTMQAVIRGYLVDPFVETTDPIFTRELQGSGFASVQFVGVQGDGRILHSVASPARYTFGAAAPVPEPATWLLVTAGGLAWSAGRRRRRSRRGLPEA